MDHKDNRGCKDFVVSWHDIDAQGRMTLRAFANYLQEAAWRHADFLGVGFDELAKHNAVWVLIGVKGEIDSYPKWNDIVTVETWSKGYKGVVSYRDFYA